MNPITAPIDINTLDRDGALREAAEKADRSLERRGLAATFTRRRALAGGTVAATALTFVGTANASSAAGDLDILNDALTLEHLEAAFYAEANANGALSGVTASFAKVVGAHEAVHVATLTKVITGLGGTPVATPTFDFKGTTSATSAFQTTSLALETTGVSAYLGQGANVKPSRSSPSRHAIRPGSPTSSAAVPLRTRRPSRSRRPRRWSRSWPRSNRLGSSPAPQHNTALPGAPYRCTRQPSTGRSRRIANRPPDPAQQSPVAEARWDVDTNYETSRFVG